jgi:short chain dehydrogenase/Fatty acid desaturase
VNREAFDHLFDMSDRTVIVTGGTRGIGLALAEGFIPAGARVVVASRKPDACEHAAAHLCELGGQAIGVPTQMGDVDDLGALVQRSVDEFGGIDVLVNNAANPLAQQETERIRAGEITIADKREILEGIWRKTKKQTLKDYVAFPLLADPFAPFVFAGNLTANLIRNVWSYMIIFCGHFPEDVQEFSIEETKAETRGMWYFRQVLGSANLVGGKLFHILSGNLSFQIEHHLFPDIPAHRHAEIAPDVQEICRRYGIPYNTGPLARQFATVVRKIVKLALPPRSRRADAADPVYAALSA